MNKVSSDKIAAIRADEANSTSELPDVGTQRATDDYSSLPKTTDRLYVTLTGQCSQLNAFNRELLDQAERLRSDIATKSESIRQISSTNASLRTSASWSQLFDVYATAFAGIGGWLTTAFEKTDIWFSFGAGLVFGGAAMGIFKYLFARREKHE